jgi:hypothetical protein
LQQVNDFSGDFDFVLAHLHSLYSFRVLNPQWFKFTCAINLQALAGLKRLAETDTSVGLISEGT